MRRHVRLADRLLVLHRRRHPQRRRHPRYAIPSRPQQQLHASEPDQVPRQRRPVLLGPLRHERRRDQLPQSTEEHAAVAGPRTGRLQHADPALEHSHVRWRSQMADLLLQQRLYVQKHHLQRVLLHPRRAPRAVHEEPDVCRLGGPHVGLDGHDGARRSGIHRV